MIKVGISSSEEVILKGSLKATKRIKKDKTFIDTSESEEIDDEEISSQTKAKVSMKKNRMNSYYSLGGASVRRSIKKKV